MHHDQLNHNQNAVTLTDITPSKSMHTETICQSKPKR